MDQLEKGDEAMANNFRHRYFDPEPAMIPVESATVIEIGDFVVLSGDYAAPAGSLADAGDAAANREAAADAFVGIAMSASAVGETEDIRVGTSGVWELNQKSAAAIHFGDPVGIYASADACEDQTCVEDATSPIGVCWKAKLSTSDPSVLVKILPSKINTLNA